MAARPPPPRWTQGNPAEVGESTLGIGQASSSLISKTTLNLKGGGRLDSERVVRPTGRADEGVEEGEARPAKAADQGGHRLGGGCYIQPAPPAKEGLRQESRGEGGGCSIPPSRGDGLVHALSSTKNLHLPLPRRPPSEEVPERGGEERGPWGSIESRQNHREPLGLGGGHPPPRDEAMLGVDDAEEAEEIPHRVKAREVHPLSKAEILDLHDRRLAGGPDDGPL
jgi:hypothetical protein